MKFFFLSPIDSWTRVELAKLDETDWTFTGGGLVNEWRREWMQEEEPLNEEKEREAHDPSPSFIVE